MSGKQTVSKNKKAMIFSMLFIVSGLIALFANAPFENELTLLCGFGSCVLLGVGIGLFPKISRFFEEL
jgi:predicted RND superfamily exporter protein